MTNLQESILAILSDAQDYRNKVLPLLSVQSREIIEEEMNSRRVFKVRINEQLNEIAQQVSDLEALERALTIARQYQQTDIEKLDSHKWTLINDAKSANLNR